MSGVRDALNKLFEEGIRTQKGYQSYVLNEFREKIKEEYSNNTESKEPVLALKFLEDYISATDEHILSFQTLKKLQMFPVLLQSVDKSFPEYVAERVNYFQNKVFNNMEQAKFLIHQKNKGIYDFILGSYNTDFRKLIELYNFLDDNYRTTAWNKMVAICETNRFLYDYISSPLWDFEGKLGGIEILNKNLESWENFVSKLEKLGDYYSVKRRIDISHEEMKDSLKKIYSKIPKLDNAKKEMDKKFFNLIDDPDRFEIKSGITVKNYYKDIIERVNNFPDCTIEDLLEKPRPVSKLKSMAISLYNSYEELYPEFMNSKMLREINESRGVTMKIIEEINTYFEQVSSGLQQETEKEYLPKLFDTLKNSKQEYLLDVLSLKSPWLGSVKRAVENKSRILDTVSKEFRNLTLEEQMEKVIDEMREKVLPEEKKSRNRNLFL